MANIPINGFDRGINQDSAHKRNGTHPGAGWSWCTNTSEPEKYKGRFGYFIVAKAFCGDGTIYKDGSAVFIEN